MREFRKKIALIVTLAMVATLAAPFQATNAVGRLTEFQDILSRIKRSGAGAATSGYTESLFPVRSNFIFVNAVNDQICVDAEADGIVAGCVTGDDTLVDLITHGGAITNTVYSGAEVAEIIATAIETALRANVNLPSTVDDDSYTVNYKDTAIDSFIFEPGVNEEISVSYDGTGPGDATFNIIDDTTLAAHISYTGDQVAAALTAGLSTADGDDNYTVTYSEASETFEIVDDGGGTGIYFDWDTSSAALYLGFNADVDLAVAGTTASPVEAGYINRFQIRADGGNDLNPDIIWTDVTSTAATSLGYATDSAAIRDTVTVSDDRVQFVLLNGYNDAFILNLNGESPAGTEPIDVTGTTIDVYVGNDPDDVLGGGIAGADDPQGLDMQLAAEINADWPYAGTVTVDYGVSIPEKFRITSVLTGTESLVQIETGAADFLRTVDMVNDVPKDGQTTNVIVSADHDLSFVTEQAVPSSGQIIITFPAEFTIPAALDHEDIDLGVGATLAAALTGQRDLGAASGAGVTGVAVNTTANTITFELATDETISAGEYVSIRIGRNTVYNDGQAYPGTGIEQIVNPSIPGQYQIKAETTEATTITFTNNTNEFLVWDPDGADAFVFNASNDAIYWDPDGAGGADTTANLTAGPEGGLTADALYTGDQIAAGIKAALEATNGTADTYTVSYNETDQHFIIQPLSGTTQVDIEWSHVNSTAARLLGYKTDDTDLYTVGVWESDIIAGTYLVDFPDAANEISGGVQDIDVATAYSGAQVATALEEVLEDTTAYPRAGTHTYAVTFSNGSFRIAETDVTDGEEPTFYWTWGTDIEAGVYPMGYTLGFTADDVVTGDFTVATGTPLDGDTTATVKQLDVSYTSVYMVDNDQITLTAGVDPNLELEINGGLAFASVEGDRDTLGVDFGSLEPNAYYKLGGAKTEFVKISVDMDCGTGGNEACIPASNETVTIRGVVYTFKRVAADAASSVTNVYASITGATQEERAAKLLTNLYRSINSSDENVRANPDRTQPNVLWVLSSKEGADSTLSGSTSDGTTGDLTVTTYTESDGSGVNSYYRKNDETTYNTDPTTYPTSLESLSDFRGHNIKVNTNAADGYTLQLRDQGPDATNPFRSWSDSADLGFGIYAYSQSTRWGNAGNSADGDDLIQEAFQGGEADNKDPQGLTTSYQTIARNDVATARDNIALEYNLRIDADQPAGNYQNTIDILVSAQY